MKKFIPLVLGAIACTTLLAGFIGSTSINNDENNKELNTKPAAMMCAPAPQTANGSKAAKGDFQISTFLSDEELSKFKYESMIFQLGPGQSDTISHRHDCDLFVTVLEGTMLLGQEFKKPDTVRTGEVFHEKRNVIHSVSINPSKDKPMKAFVVFIRKDGRSPYTPLYPKK